MQSNAETTMAVISVGSNIDKEHNVPAALRRLSDSPDLDVLAVSDVLETTAIDADGLPADQEAFHNLAVLVATSLSHELLHQQLRQIEHDLGRRRTGDKYAPRPIDLDIAIFGLVKVDGDMPNLAAGATIADDVATALHVAQPIAQLLPEWIHPERNMTLRELAHDLTARR